MMDATRMDATRFEHPLLEQVSTYEDMREELEQRYPGRWVIIFGSGLVGDYGSFQEADEAATELGLNKLECLFKPVGVETVIIHTGPESR